MTFLLFRRRRRRVRRRNSLENPKSAIARLYPGSHATGVHSLADCPLAKTDTLNELAQYMYSIPSGFYISPLSITIERVRVNDSNPPSLPTAHLLQFPCTRLVLQCCSFVCMNTCVLACARVQQ